MNEIERRIVNNFKRQLQRRGGVYRTILFGSRARGDADPESDLDVVVVWEGEISPELRDYISACAWEAGFTSGIVVVPVVFSRQEWEQGPERNSIFVKAVERDGVSI